MKTFKKRSINVLFTLVSGSAGESEKVEFDGLRVSTRVHFTPGAYGGADIQIFGLTKEFMRRLIAMYAFGWTGNNWVNNRIALRYVDETTVTIFEGGIVSALVDYNAAPDVPLAIYASTTFEEQMTVPGGLNFPGTTSIEYILRRILDNLPERKLDNQGVTGTLTDTSVNGSVMDMIDQVCRYANIDYWMVNNVLVIAPKGSQFEGETPIELTPENGLAGWPVLTESGCNAVALYSPDFAAMRTVNLSCPDLFDGKQMFYITGLTHELDSEVPGGRWHTRLTLGLNTPARQ